MFSSSLSSGEYRKFHRTLSFGALVLELCWRGSNYSVLGLECATSLQLQQCVSRRWLGRGDLLTVREAVGFAAETDPAHPSPPPAQQTQHGYTRLHATPHATALL